MKRGFTLIELIVVIAIIAILAAIIAPNAFRAVEKAKISSSIEDFRSIKTAAMAYYSDCGTWPTTCAGTACSAGFVTDPTVTGWDGPYLEKWANPSKWNAGAYNYTNASGTVFNATAASERYITITLTPLPAAQNVDLQIDGAKDGTTGSVRYTGTGNVSLNLLISRDGPVN